MITFSFDTIDTVITLLNRHAYESRRILWRAQEAPRKHPGVRPGSAAWRRMRNNVENAAERCNHIENVQKDFCCGINDMLADYPDHPKYKMWMGLIIEENEYA